MPNSESCLASIFDSFYYSKNVQRTSRFIFRIAGPIGYPPMNGLVARIVASNPESDVQQKEGSSVRNLSYASFLY